MAAEVAPGVVVDAEVVAWAEEHRVSQFLGIFAEAGFDTLPVLAKLEESDLDWMKISAPGQRKKILLAAAALREPSPAAGAPPPSEAAAALLQGMLGGGGGFEEARRGQQAILRMLETSGISDEVLMSRIPHIIGGRVVDEGNALYRAACSSDLASVEELLEGMEAGTITLDINERCGSTMSTPLLVAVGNGNLDIVQALLKHGADHRICDSRGSSVLLTAIALENVELLQCLLQYDADCAGISFAKVTVLNANYQEGEDGSQTAEDRLLLNLDSSGRSLLYLACCQPNLALVVALLEHIPEVQINRPNSNAEKHTPLFAAITRGDVDLARLLLEEYGANPNVIDGTGSTPLLCAVVDHDDKDLVEALLQHGADATFEDEMGMVALDIAAGLEKKDILTVLVAHEKEQGSLVPVISVAEHEGEGEA